MKFPTRFLTVLMQYSIVLLECAPIGENRALGKRQDPTSRGPVLFPNDATPSPRPPLVVTSRPLAEQIERSDQRGSILVPKPQRISIWNQIDNKIDDLYNVDYSALPKSYEELLEILQLQSGVQNNSSLLEKHPYAAVAKKLKYLAANRQRNYNTYEQQTVVPPIYTALGNYAKNKVLKNNNNNNYNLPKSGTKGLNSKKGRKGSRRTKTGRDEDEYYNDNFANEAKQYAFSYTVKDHETGDDFSHSQHHSGSATNGEYRVKLPDGRLQIVSYTADNGGYKAEVRYEGEKIDEAQQQQQQQYQEDQYDGLGRIVVPSKEDAEYDDYYYEDKIPKEVLITSKPSYIHTTPSTLLIYQNGVNYVSTPAPEVEYVNYPRNGIEVTTPSPIVSYDHLDVPIRNTNGGQVRYTTIAPVVAYTVSNVNDYYDDDRSGKTADIRKYFSYKK